MQSAFTYLIGKLSWTRRAATARLKAPTSSPHVSADRADLRPWCACDRGRGRLREAAKRRLRLALRIALQALPHAVQSWVLLPGFSTTRALKMGFAPSFDDASCRPCLDDTSRVNNERSLVHKTLLDAPQRACVIRCADHLLLRSWPWPMPVERDIGSSCRGHKPCLATGAQAVPLN